MELLVADQPSMDLKTRLLMNFFSIRKDKSLFDFTFEKNFWSKNCNESVTTSWVGWLGKNKNEIHLTLQSINSWKVAHKILIHQPSISQSKCSVKNKIIVWHDLLTCRVIWRGCLCAECPGWWPGCRCWWRWRPPSGHWCCSPPPPRPRTELLSVKHLVRTLVWSPASSLVQTVLK